jgi:O-Antigen ligase
MTAITQQSQNPPYISRIKMQAAIRWLLPAMFGAVFAAILCLATSASAKVGAVVIGGLVCLGLLLVISYFQNAVEDLSLFALALTLSISLKFHPIFRTDHFGGSIGVRISITELLMAVLVAIILFRNRAGSLHLRVDTAILVSFSAYWILAASSAIAGFDRELGLFQLIATMQAVAVFIFLVNYLTSRRRLLIYIAGFLVALSCQSALTIAQSRNPSLDVFHFLGAPQQDAAETVNGDVALPTDDLGTTFVEGEVQQRPAGFLIHPNVLAFYLVLAIPTAAGVFLVGKSRWLVLLALAALLSAAVALYVSLSRSAWAGILFACILGVIFAGRSMLAIERHKKFVMAVILLAAVVGLAAKADRIYSRIFDTAGEAIEFRQNLANIALNMIEAHPILGVGLNSFTEATDAYDPSGSQRVKKFPVHDVYLLETSETGVPGGLAFLAMVITLVVKTIGSARQTPENWRLLPLLIAVGIAGFWLTQISDFAYRVPVLTTILWSQVALAMAATHVARTGDAL